MSDDGGMLEIRVTGFDALATAVNALTAKVDQLMTSAEEKEANLNAVLDNIAADVSGLKATAEAKQAQDAATIEQLRKDLAGAIAAGGDTPAAVTAAVDKASAAFAVTLQPLLDKAIAIDESTPAPIASSPVA